MKPYLTTSEAADVCQVSRGTILRWIREGHIKSITTLGGHNRLSSEELLLTLKTMGLPAPQTSSNLSKLKLLIVEDDESLSLLLKSALMQKFSDVPIQIVGNGFDAGFFVEQRKPNFILLDANLPGISGEEICKMIRRLRLNEKIYILGMTNGGRDVVERMLAVGADECVQEPFDYDAISERVSRFEKELHNDSQMRKAG